MPKSKFSFIPRVQAALAPSSSRLDPSLARRKMGAISPVHPALLVAAIWLPEVQSTGVFVFESALGGSARTAAGAAARPPQTCYRRIGRWSVDLDRACDDQAREDASHA